MNPSTSTAKTETVVLDRATWETTMFEGRLERVQPKPETWFDLRKVEGLPPNSPILALLSCPRCREANALSKSVTRVDGLGKLFPNFVCGFASCRFTAEIYLDKFHDKPLYALALENGERIELSYTHANNVEEASRGIAGKLLQGWRVIGIGPAIGFHVKPGSKGSVLIA
jgi:hypothetical protein